MEALHLVPRRFHHPLLMRFQRGSTEGRLSSRAVGLTQTGSHKLIPTCRCGSRRRLSTPSVQSQVQSTEPQDSASPPSTQSQLPLQSQKQPQTPAQSSPQFQTPLTDKSSLNDGWSDFVRKPRPQGTTPPPSPTVARVNPANLAADLKKHLGGLDFSQNSNRAQTSSTPIPSSSSSADSSSFPPGAPPTTSPRPKDVMGIVDYSVRENEASRSHDAREAVNLRLSPLLGRTVPVDPGRGLDLQSAFRILESRCSYNAVKRDSVTQRTHVRKGQKKKDMKRFRWRELFKQGFLQEVATIRKMKRQGW